MSTATENTAGKLLVDLRQTLDRMNLELDRIEILTGALCAFAHPVPDYEPTFQHLKPMPPARELGSREESPR